MAKKFTPEFKQEMIEAYLSGTSFKKLAKLYDVSDVSIRNWVEKSGGTIRPGYPQYDLEFKQKIADLYVSGLSTYRLQQDYHVDAHAISKWVKAFGYDLVPRSRPRSIEFKRKMVDIYLAGTSSYQILKDYGISPENTCRWVKELGEEIRPVTTILSANGEEKTCSMCEIMQPLDNYSLYPDGIAGRQSRCRTCQQTTRRSQTYKLSPKDFAKILESQGNVCAICKQKPMGQTGPGKGWQVDHDHSCCPAKGKTCGKCIRGILCSPCNNGLGQFKDNEESLKNALSYIQKYRENKSAIQETTKEASS